MSEITAITASFLYRELKARLVKQPEAKPQILAHIKCVTGCDTLESLANGAKSEEQKSRPMAECLRAMLKNDYRGLVSGHPPVEPVKPVQVKPETPTTLATPPVPVQTPETVVPMPVMHPKPEAIKAVEEIVRRVMAEEAPKLVQAAIKGEMHETKYELLTVMQRAYENHRRKLAEAIKEVE